MPNIKQLLGDKSQTYDDILKKIAFNIRCCIPAIVQSFNAENCTVEVQPAIREEIVNEDNTVQYMNLPLLINVPVVYPTSSDAGVTFPLKENDECLVFFSDLSIDNFWEKGGVQNPIEVRRHDLSDGFAIPCRLSVQKAKNPKQFLNVEFGDVSIKFGKEDMLFTGGYGSFTGEQVYRLITGSLIAGVVSFNGREGVVFPEKGDYTADMVGTYSESEIDNLLKDKAKSKHASQHAANGDDPVTPKDIGALSLSGGTLTGNLYGKYIVGTWLQTTATTDLNAAPERIPVLDTSGWLYYRTLEEILTDFDIPNNSAIRATTSAYGITRLSSSTTSNSNTVAATPRAVKNAAAQKANLINGTATDCNVNITFGTYRATGDTVNAPSGVRAGDILFVVQWDENTVAQLFFAVAYRILYIRFSNVGSTANWSDWEICWSVEGQLKKITVQAGGTATVTLSADRTYVLNTSDNVRYGVCIVQTAGSTIRAITPLVPLVNWSVTAASGLNININETNKRYVLIVNMHNL